MLRRRFTVLSVVAASLVIVAAVLPWNSGAVSASSRIASSYISRLPEHARRGLDMHTDDHEHLGWFPGERSPRLARGPGGAGGDDRRSQVVAVDERRGERRRGPRGRGIVLDAQVVFSDCAPIISTRPSWRW